MTEIAIATANYSPTHTQAAAGKDGQASGSPRFLDMLLANSSHRMANSSLLFITESSLDAGQDPAQAWTDETDTAEQATWGKDNSEAAPTYDDETEARAEEPRKQERGDEQPNDETAGWHETRPERRADRPTEDRGEEAAIQAAPASQANGTSQSAASQPAAAQPAAAQAGGRDAAAASLAATALGGTATAKGKDAAVPTPDKQAGQTAASVKTEMAGLVSKPQQSLAQAATVAAQETSRSAQATADAGQADAEPAINLKIGKEPVIRRPAANPQAVAQAMQSGGNGAAAANAPVAGFAAESTAPRTALPAGQSAGAGAAAAGAIAAAGQKTVPVAAGLTAVAPDSFAAAEAKGSKASGFAQNLKSTPETFQQLSLQMSRAAALGKDRISLQLHPAELGRVDVKLEFAQDQSMRAVITAERPETLDLLQRDSRALERALQDAGVKLDNNSLNFAQRNDQQPGYDGSAGGGEAELAEDTGGEEERAESTASAASGEQGNVNIKV